ncbi:xylA [Symbiodinium sp. CCMP2592]|nr:xylA [Symbiodinium sp. CCMP2592]
MGCSVSYGPEEITIGAVTQKRKGKDSKKAELANKDYQDRIEFLLTVPLFQRLPKDEHPVVASMCEGCKFKRNDQIIKQGARGEEFFVIRRGQAEVFVKKTNGQKEKIATLKAGDHFGEGALLRDEPRAATVVALSDMHTLKIKRTDFQALGLHQKLKFGRRVAVSSGKKFSKAKDPVPKTAEDMKLITQAIMSNENLSVIGNLEEKIPSLAEVMWKEYVKAGRHIITEGDVQADFFYIVHEGKCEIVIKDKDAFDDRKFGGQKIVMGVYRRGPESLNPLAFKYYQPDELVMGKKMRDWCRFAVSWWHTFNGQMGTDPFSNVKTHVRPWDVDSSLDTFLTRVDVAFEFFTKLGVDYYCFHDVDVAPQGENLQEFQANLDTISEKLLQKQKETGVKLLWATQNLFSHPRYKDGAATAPSFDAFAYGCAQTRKMLEVGKKLGGETHVFWGGREGFATALNTKVKSELDHMASFLKMATAYKKKIGFEAQFCIEPKAREPTAHQYDYDAQTVIGFLYQHGLEKDFKVNIEPNHTTLAGHDYEHDLRMASALGMLGSVDCNAGQPYLGWDTDEFPSDPRKALLSMLIIVQQGGIAPGGNNFDCKLRRESTDIEDMFIAHIGGMDCLARGLLGACKLLQENLLQKALDTRYLSWQSPLGKKVEEGKASLEEIEAYALKTPEPATASQSFGELALLYCAPRAASVKATTNAVLWVLDRAHFKEILLRASAKKLEEYRGYLDAVPLLSALLKEERLELAQALVEMHFYEGEQIITQGETGATFYIMFSGTVDVYKDDMRITTLEASMARRTTQYFGEFALLEDEKRAATVKVTSASARCLVLDRDAFQALLGPLKEIIESQKCRRQTDRFSQHEEMEAQRGAALSPDRVKIYKQDLARVGLLGVGGFSKVELWQHTETGATYALKSIDKGVIMKYRMQETVYSEKKVMMMTRSPFLIGLVECFNDEEGGCLEILMEAALGGELLVTYSRKGFWGSMEHARYYVAGASFALEHLHERRIVYRDLKPENVLLDTRGFLKLTDMGLAKLVIGKTYTTCGTPEYFAPEVIALSGQTSAVDWWTLGIFLYELMCSSTPFIAPHPMQIYAKVMRGIDKASFPSACHGGCERLIKALSRPLPADRLPVKGLKHLQEHEWFEGFDWNALQAGEMPSPYVPDVADDEDLSNFFADPKDLPETIPYLDPEDGWDETFATVE